MQFSLSLSFIFLFLFSFDMKLSIVWSIVFLANFACCAISIHTESTAKASIPQPNVQIIWKSVKNDEHSIVGMKYFAFDISICNIQVENCEIFDYVLCWCWCFGCAMHTFHLWFSQVIEWNIAHIWTVFECQHSTIQHITIQPFSHSTRWTILGFLIFSYQRQIRILLATPYELARAIINDECVTGANTRTQIIKYSNTQIIDPSVFVPSL